MLNVLKLAKKSIKLSFVLLSLFVGFVIFDAHYANAAYGIDVKIKQVKIVDGPAVYYLDHARGMKKPYVSAKAFLSYGNKWSDIKIASIDELNKWPDVKLIKSEQSPFVYYISADRKFFIESEQKFIDAGFKWEDIVTISQTDLDEYQTAENFQPAGSIAKSDGGQLAVALDSSSPKDGYFAMHTQDNLAAVFSIRAAGKPIEIKRLILDLNGIFRHDAINKIYLADESDIAYDASSIPNNRSADFNFGNNPIIVSPGEDRKIKVYVDLNNILENTTNHFLQISINDQKNISGTKVTGIFPVFAGAFKIMPAGDLLEKVYVNEQTLSRENNKAIIGSTEKNIAKFNVMETSGRADVFVKELKFTNSGNAQIGSLNNFKLRNKAGQIVAAADRMTSKRELVFKLNDYKIKKSGNETFTVAADIAGGENETINIRIERAKIASSQGAFNLNVNINNLDETIAIKREPVSVLAKSLKANDKVFINQSGVIIGNFEIRNGNKKIKLASMSFGLEKNGSMPGFDGTVYIADYASGEIYGYFNGAKFSDGAVNIGLNGIDLNAKQNAVLSLITTIPDSVPNGGNCRIIFNSMGYRAENGLLFSDAVNATGEKFTVNKSNLYIYPNNESGVQTFTKGEKNVKIASFMAEAAAGSDVLITSITFSQGKETSGMVSFENGFSNLRFYIGLSHIRTIKNPYAGDLTIGGFQYAIKSGARTEIKIYADTETDLRVSEAQLAISNVAAMNKNSSIPSVVNNLNTNSHKAVFGKAAAEISKIIDGFAAKGEDDNVIASFKVKNSGHEDLRLQSVTVNVVDHELTYSLGYKNLKIINRDTQRRAGNVIAKPVAGANRIDLGYYGECIVKAGQEAVFDVHVSASDMVADGNVEIYFSDFSAKGKNSGVKADISGDPTDAYNFAVMVGTFGTFIKPVGGSITYGFHDPDYPYKDVAGEHSGIDIAASQGSSVKAAADGIVIAVFAGSDDQASYITISHNPGLATKYGHLSQINAILGQNVKQGDTIGLSGGTPGTPGAGARTNGAHLHFEVLKNEIAVDPEDYL